MEIIALPQNGLRIKAKNVSFIVNPVGKIDEDIIILTRNLDNIPSSENLVLSGPGEYEVSGVSIKGEKTVDGISYSFLEDNQSLLVLPSSASVEKSDTEGHSGVIVLADKKDESLSSLTSDFVGVVGSEEFLPADTANTKKIDKVNLKKIEEYKGMIIHLSK